MFYYAMEPDTDRDHGTAKGLLSALQDHFKQEYRLTGNFDYVTVQFDGNVSGGYLAEVADGTGWDVADIQQDISEESFGDGTAVTFYRPEGEDDGRS